MTRRKLLAALDIPRVERSIAAAERACSAEFRVSVAGAFWGSPRRFAERVFRRLDMRETRERNGVLLLVAPWHRRVELVVDAGIGERLSAHAFDAAVAQAAAAFRDGRYTDGLCGAVDGLARALAVHFPPRPADINELPDAVDR